MNELLIETKQQNNTAIRTEVRLITPETAKQWLTVNTMNRRVRQNTVDYYADQMKRGQWTMSENAITFSNTHKLMNGQHRLLAVIKSNTVQPFLVIFNMDESAMVNMDQQEKRGHGDVFQLKDIKEYANVSSGINKYFTLKKGRVTGGDRYTARTKTDTKTTITDMLDFYYSNQTLVDEILTHSSRFYTRFKYFKRTDYFSYIAFLILDKKHPESKVYDFFKQLAHGGVDVKNNTISILRDKLMFNETANHKMTNATRYNLIAKAWNAYVKGIEYKVLYVKSSEDKHELL